MNQLLITLHVFGTRLLERGPAPDRAEDGSVTIEQVLWAVAMIAIVAIVVAVIRAYVTTQAGNIG